MRFQDKPITRERQCLKFVEPTEIGYEKTSGEKKYLEISISPCLVDCNMDLNDPLYPDMIAEFLANYALYLNFIDSTSDFGNYTNPID